MPTAIKPAIYDPLLRTTIFGSRPRTRMRWRANLAREEGLLVGISAAANVRSCDSRWRNNCLRRAESGLIVTILCDGGQKYLSESFWNDNAMIEIEANPGRPCCCMPNERIQTSVAARCWGRCKATDKPVTEAVPLENA